MAAPSAPASVAVKQGFNPQSARVSWASGGGDAEVSYTVYIHNATGVSTSTYSGKVPVAASRLFVDIDGIGYEKVFATVTATNADGTSAAATEASGFIIQ